MICFRLVLGEQKIYAELYCKPSWSMPYSVFALSVCSKCEYASIAAKVDENFDWGVRSDSISTESAISAECLTVLVSAHARLTIKAHMQGSGQQRGWHIMKRKLFQRTLGVSFQFNLSHVTFRQLEES